MGKTYDRKNMKFVDSNLRGVKILFNFPGEDINDNEVPFKIHEEGKKESFEKGKFF